MHKVLKKVALIGIGVAFAATPAMAVPQQAMEAKAPQNRAPVEAPASGKEAAMKDWPADKQAAFKAWPAETQAYFWSLTEERQKMFWALSDSDKVALSQMAEPQRESVWAQIEARTRPSQSG